MDRYAAGSIRREQNNSRNFSYLDAYVARRTAAPQLTLRPRRQSECPNWWRGRVYSEMQIQTPRLYWQADIAPAARIIHGDCLSWMLGVEGRESYDLVFADPPFNIGREYDGISDSRPWDEYIEWTKDWLIAAYALLRKGGVLYVHVPDRVAPVVLRMMQFWDAEQIAWIIWHYRFGQWTSNSFISSKCHGLVFKKPGAEHIWNPNDVLVPSDRAAKYGDSRTENSATPGLRVPFDVWGADISTIDGEFMDGDGSYWGRVSGSHSNAERRPLHDNQLPERYLERIIRAWTNPGSWVLDAFLGSGTSMVVARALGRHSTGVEQSEAYCESIKERVLKGAVRV